MLSLPSIVRIYLHAAPVNLHFGFDRLANLVREDLGQDPLSGHLFVFRNRCGDRVTTGAKFTNPNSVSAPQPPGENV